ncbi:MAG: hypothetical protein LBI69_03745 [Puniceicoccales bacterium]|nr:hypothetical protein [Puniceicoccales bacterium]
MTINSFNFDGTVNVSDPRTLRNKESIKLSDINAYKKIENLVILYVPVLSECIRHFVANQTLPANINPLEPDPIIGNVDFSCMENVRKIRFSLEKYDTITFGGALEEVALSKSFTKADFPKCSNLEKIKFRDLLPKDNARDLVAKIKLPQNLNVRIFFDKYEWAGDAYILE